MLISSSVCFSNFMLTILLSAVRTKFRVPDAAHLDIFCETDTAVDIFLELLEAHLFLTVCKRIQVKVGFTGHVEP